MVRLDKATKVELIIFALMLLICYLVASFISFNLLWLIECSALARGGFVLGWIVSSLLIIYVTETK